MKDVFERHRIFLLADRIVSWGVFLILLLTYWLTFPPEVSFWDCPEYVTAAVRLEPGHPPGNPFWMLTEKFFTLFFPARYAALVINLSSGLFTALAGMLLAKSIFIGAVWVLKTRDGLRRRLHAFYAAGAAVIGALAFGWCDSTWYSAIEAEVYAMSIFLTALSVWLMLKWARASNVTLAWRYLILLAYIFGLALGVHQLNLLVIPALAVVWALRRGVKSKVRILFLFIGSLAAVGCILKGMMPSTIALAAEMELFATNTLGLPYLSGVVIYIFLLGLSLLTALAVTRNSDNRGALSLALFPVLFLSGLFIISNHFLAGAAVSALVSIIIVRRSYFKPHRLNMMMWMLTMLLTGYSSYALIPIRGNVAAPPNAAMPGNPFSFAAYQAREQYGAAPLLYGNTPNSRPLLIEEFNDDSIPVYKRYVFENTTRQIVPFYRGARLRKPSPLSPYSAEDSAINRKAFEKGHDAYLIRGYRSNQVLTPELDMWFPRITSRDPGDLASYESWAGMSEEEMVKVEISEAIDSLGNPVARMGADGKRTRPVALKPTYLQNLQFLATYQIGYMYLRYLMWNFSGRQNDIPSTGEVEHGNFITGIEPIDNAMLSAEDALPPHAGTRNPGRNRYFMLPLLLGIWGMVWMIRSNWRGRMACGVVAMLFIMTGVAIVVYLNQTPGEPRERDYSFLGSYMAFAIWIGAGALGLARTIAEIVEKFIGKTKEFNLKRMIVAASLGFIPSLGVVALMLQQNYDDHNRSGRAIARNFAINILNSLDRNAIIFVDGDNYTFPLWYAQEVEGVRRDVRVVNLSYLSTPLYSAQIQGQWEEAPALNNVLKAADILYHAHITDRGKPNSSGRIDALEMLRMLKANPDTLICADEIVIGIADGDSLTIPIKALSRNGDSRNFDFRKLMLLDIIASNNSPDNKTIRPVYWQKNASQTLFLGLFPHFTDRLYAYRLGKEPDSVTDSVIMEIAEKFIAPNGKEPERVYMDRLPASMSGRLRADHTAGARRLLRNGHKKEALELALRTKRDFADHPYSFLPVKMGDSVFVTEKEFAELFIELADSLNREDLRRIGENYMQTMNNRKSQWKHYRQALSPKMRCNMSKSP